MSELPLTDGPVQTEYGLRCIGDSGRCRHLAYHDWHYPYCAAQPVEGQKYPWPGAGKHIFHTQPDSVGCPYIPAPPHAEEP